MYVPHQETYQILILEDEDGTYLDLVDIHRDYWREEFQGFDGIEDLAEDEYLRQITIVDENEARVVTGERGKYETFSALARAMVLDSPDDYLTRPRAGVRGE